LNAYEAIFILNPDQEEEKVKQLVTVIETTITKNGGQIENSKVEGKKNLAYPINKKKQNIQLLIDLSLAPDKITAINNVFRLNEDIYRVMITKKIVKTKKPVKKQQTNG